MTQPNLTDHDRFAGEALVDPETRRAYRDANFERGRAAMLADVLIAVRDIDAIQRWATDRIPLGAVIDSRVIHDYLADRFAADPKEPK